MIKNYFKIAWRNLIKNKVSSFINISGLAVGMAVAILIGLWIWDEVSFDKYNKNYDSIAKVMENGTSNGYMETQNYIPMQVANELRAKYGRYFKCVVMCNNLESHILALGDKKIKQQGLNIEPQAPQLMDLKLISGSYSGLKDPECVMLSASVAKEFFGNADPINKVLKIDDRVNLKVTGVYRDIPNNSEFKGYNFLLSLDYSVWAHTDQWNSDGWHVYVQLADNANIDEVSKKIANIKQDNVAADNKKSHWGLFLDPMSKWHLYANFYRGQHVGGLVDFVWLFGTIGGFVLLLACINFMNLSTARSEKRAKEVGIRKAVGSVRSQLIYQFFIESLLVVFLAFLLALLLVQLALPSFNQVAGKNVAILWGNPVFWLTGVCFCLFTGAIAGSYPALYLSSFNPIKALKGTFKVGRYAAVPRKVLVVIQFSVSVILIIGTIVVFRQVQYAKNRPVGYNRGGLIMSELVTVTIHKHFNAVRDELKNSGAIVEMAESESPPSDIYNTIDDASWKGKDPNLAASFSNMPVSMDYGKTMGWEFIQGRDFSDDYATDSSAFIINEAAVRFMRLKKPLGETITWNGKPYHIIGVVKNIVMASPYEPVSGALFHLYQASVSNIVIKLNPLNSTRSSLAKITAIFQKYDPAIPFDYQFVDTAYAKKFGDEERIGKLTSFFAVLAVFISCMGLFGMASFMAEQRVKEIGVRKVLGASVFNLWQLLIKDFVILNIISLLIATPISYYFMHKWLQGYTYRSHLSWWIFAATGLGAVIVTLITISFQSVKAAIANPAKSLRSE